MKNIEIGHSAERVANLLKKYINSKCEGDSVWFQDVGKMPTIYEILFAIDALDKMEARKEVSIGDLIESPRKGTPIETLELSLKTYNKLTNYDIRTVEDLCKRSEEDIIKMRGVGMGMFNEITKALTERGLELRKE